MFSVSSKLPLPARCIASADRISTGAGLSAAVRGADREHKLLLIDMGGNWCPDCRVLADIMELPEVKAFLKNLYVIVEVDVGRYDKNLDIADRYDAHYDKGAPAVLVVDPKTNQLVNKGRTLALRDARHMTPQGLADWLAQWT
jgi:thiol-disulfide isomerase/thioredoxin